MDGRDRNTLKVVEDAGTGFFKSSQRKSNQGHLRSKRRKENGLGGEEKGDLLHQQLGRPLTITWMKGLGTRPRRFHFRQPSQIYFWEQTILATTTTFYHVTIPCLLWMLTYIISLISQESSQVLLFRLAEGLYWNIFPSYKKVNWDSKRFSLN